MSSTYDKLMNAAKSVGKQGTAGKQATSQTVQTRPKSTYEALLGAAQTVRQENDRLRNNASVRGARDELYALAQERAARERAEAWNSLGVIDKAKDVIGTTARGTGAQIMATYAGAEAALAGEGTILNDTYALGRSMLDRNDGVSAWDAFDAYGNLFIQRGGGVLPNALDRLYDKAGALAGKVGIQLDTENDVFSRWNNYLQDKKAAAEKAFYDKVGEVDNIYTAGQKYRQQKLNEVQQEAQEKYSQSKAAQNFYKYGTMVGAQIPNTAAAVLTAFLMPEAAPGVVGGIAGATTEGLQAYSAMQAAGKGAQTMNALRAGISGMTNNPNFWTAAVNETGAAYNEAIEAGVDPSRASTYAVSYGVLSAIIEVGGADEALGGLQAFPKNIRKAIEEKDIAKAAWEYGKTIVSEIGEEEVQGMLQNAMKGGMLGQNAPLFSTENPDAIINPKQMLETARDTAITTAILGAGQRTLVGGAQKIADTGAYYGGSEQTIRAALEAAETEAEKSRVTKIQEKAAVRAAEEGKGADYRLSIGEARQLQEIVRKNQGEEKAGKILTQGSIENAYRGTPIDNEGNTLTKEEASALSALYDPQQNEAKTFYPAAHEAYQLGYNGLSLAETQSRAQLGGYLAEKQLRDAWKLGALRRVGGVDKSAGEVKNEVRAHLAKYGEEGANRLAAVHDGLTTAEEYAEIVDKALFYAKNGADLQTVVEETRNESSPAKWAQDRELGKLTDEQIAVIQELGPQLAAQDRETVRKTAEAFAGIREAAAEANTLTQVNKQLSAARNSLESARTELQAAEKEMRQMQDSGAWSTEEGAYNAVVRRVEELDGIIENGEKLVRDLEAKRAEAQKAAPQKRKKGTVSFDESVDQKNLNRQQKKNIAAVQALADAVNIDYVLYAGKQNEGGYYADGQIYMNINAAVDVTVNGQKTKMSIFGFTLSHELTHHLKKYAPEEYQALRDFVVEKIRAEKGEKGFSRLVQEQIRMEKSAKKLSYDQAVDEVVANSCLTMLRDSKTVEELARQNMTLAEKVVDFLEDFVGKIKAAFEGADIHSDHALFNAAKAMEKEADSLLQLWDAALKTADVNYNAAQAVGKLSPATGSEAQAMAWEIDTEYDFGVSQFDINDYVEKAYRKENRQDYKKWAEAEERLIVDVKGEIPDIAEYVHALRDNDVRHIRNSHGEQTNEKYPITENDQKLIPYIVKNYDKVLVKSQDGKPGIVYVKAMDNNLTYYLESVTTEYHGEKLLVNKQMIKTGLDDVPNMPGLEEAINKKQAVTDFLADLKKAHMAYARSAYRNRTVSKNSVPESDATVKENSEQFMAWDGVEERAVEHFGTTDDFRIAGYILGDGRMLDFSGAHWLEGYDDEYVAEWRKKNDIRQVDHEDIYEAFGDAGLSDSALAFIRRGNIRIAPEAPGLELYAKKEPTAQQYAQIRDFVNYINDRQDYFTNGSRLWIDLTTSRKERGRMSYTGEIRPDRVVNDLKHYYKTGEVREQGTSAWFMTWEDQVSFEDVMDENAQMSMDDLEDVTMPGEGQEQRQTAKTMPGMEKVQTAQGPRRERALAAAITQQTKKLLEGYTPTDWDRSVTAEDIDGWLDADEYHGVMGSMFDDGMQAADLLYDLAQAQPEKAEDAYLVMEQLTRTMNPVYAQVYTVPGGYDRTPGFTEWYMKRNPSVYYPGYKPGDLFEDSLWGEGKTAKEIEYLNELLNRPEVSPEKKAEAQAFLDRLTAPEKRWQVFDRTIDPRSNPSQMRDYQEVFYMSWDNDHNDWAPEFYSKLNRTVAEWTNDKGRPMPEKMGAGAVIPWLRGRGVKAEEIRWSGLQPWLEGRKSVTKDELAAYLAGNMTDIQTEVLNSKKQNHGFLVSTSSGEDLANFDVLIDALEWCMERARKEYGEDAKLEWDQGEDYVYVYLEENGQQVELYAIDTPWNEEVEGDTEWMAYRLRGGSNYREILFKLPGLTHMNNALRVHWKERGPGTIAHARIQDMEEVENGKRVLFIEEIQSDLHNEGAKKGFEGDDGKKTDEALQRLKDKLKEKEPAYNKARSRAYEIAERIYKDWKESGHKGLEKTSEDTLATFISGKSGFVREVSRDISASDMLKEIEYGDFVVNELISDEEWAEIRSIRRAVQEHDEVAEEYGNVLAGSEKLPPDVPFAGSADTYHEYVMKHLLRLAAEGDYDAIGWTTAQQQADRWSDEFMEGYKIEYDQALPKFMNKYTKQWGGKVGDMALAVPYTNGQETRVWAVEITPEMKKAVLQEGQPLFMSWDGTEDTEQEWQDRLEAYSRLEAEQAIQDQVFQSIRELTRSQKKSLAEIQKRLKIGKTPEARMDDVQRMAKSLMSRYNSTMKEEDVVREVAAIWNYVLQDQDPSGNVVRNMAEELAEKIVGSAEVEVIDETEEETLKEIRGRIKGQKLVISADETGDIPGYANLAEFRKKNFGRFSVAGRNSDAVTDQHVPVDSLYEELRNSYGGYYFPESTSQGEMLGILSGYFDAAERQTANPFTDSYGEAVEAIAGEISRSAWWDAVRLTPLTEAEQTKVRNAEGREIIQNLRDERKITKSQAEKLEKPMAAEEQLMDQAEALKAQIRELVEAGEMSKTEAAELQASLLKMTRRVDTLEEQYRMLEEAADKRVAQIREEGAAKVAEAIAKQQEKNAKNVQALKDHFKEVQQNARARREESGNVKKYREQVTKKAKKLFELLMTNSDKKHVPEVLKGPLAQFLTELDFTSKRQLRGGDVTKNDRAFAANLQRLEQILSNQQAYISGDPNAKSDLGGYIDVSPDNLEYLRQVSELITKALTRGETFTVNSMTGTQLKDLSKLLSNLYTAINRMNDFMANARYESVREAAAGDIGYFNSLGEAGEKAESRWRNWVYWKDGVPYYVFNRFGEGGKSIFDGFTRGWEKLAFRAQEIINFTEALYTDKEVGEWTKDLHEFTLEDGSKIRMTTAQVMELSMLLNREQAQKHIMKGGIRIGTVRTKKGAVNDTNHYHLTAGDIANIAGSLTARQTEVARALQRFMAEKGAEWGNEISMRRFGYNFYTEGENYYPIRTDPSDRPMSDTDMPQNASMFRLLNLSSSKALNPKASNALIVGDIFDTFANHTSDMAKLNAMGLPVLDAIKWFNYKERVNINMETGEHTTKTLQRAMERAYGTQAGHYFRTLMKDINGAVEAGDRGAGIWSNLTARYKAVAVGANLRVALLQPTSYLRALNVIDGKYLAAAFAHRNAYKEAMQYSGTAVWKSMGYYDTDISKGMRGQIKHDDSWRDKVVEASMKAAEIGDKRTWGRLWVACKLQMKAQNPGLSGEELKQATADLFRKTIYASQVMDSTLTRSEMMRSKSLGDKLLTPFMAEPTLSFNIMMDAYSNYALDERRFGKAEAWKKNAGLIGRAFTAYVATAAFNALAESIWDAVRDDDDEEFLEKFMQALFGEDNLLEGNLVQDISILNKIPGVKDVISMLTGYTNRNIATEGIENIVNAARIWIETIQLAKGTLEKATKVTYYGRMTEWGRIYKSLQALSQVTGLPIYPLTREAVAIWNTLMNGRKDEWKILTYDANQLSESALAAWSETVQPTGISQGQFKKIMNEADANGSVQPTQDELGEYLTAALADGTVTEEQAQALWNSRGWSDKHDFNWWREKGGGAEAPAETNESAQAAPKTEAKAETKKAETGTKPASTSIPVYSSKREATMAAKPAGMSEERYAEILRAADLDGNSSLKQDELGAALKRAVERREMSHEEAARVWASQGWSANHSYEWWLSKH